MQTYHLQLIYLTKLVIFYSYVNLPEGITAGTSLITPFTLEYTVLCFPKWYYIVHIDSLIITWYFKYNKLKLSI